MLRVSSIVIIFGNLVQADNEKSTDWDFKQSPVDLLNTVKGNANKKKSEEVQKTDLDNTTSKTCKDLAVDDRFTLTRTLCYVKDNV